MFIKRRIINKLWYIHTVEYYGDQSVTAKWVNFTIQYQLLKVSGKYSLYDFIYKMFKNMQKPHFFRVLSRCSIVKLESRIINIIQEFEEQIG